MTTNNTPPQGTPVVTDRRSSDANKMLATAIIAFLASCCGCIGFLFSGMAIAVWYLAVAPANRFDFSFKQGGKVTTAAILLGFALLVNLASTLMFVIAIFAGD